MPKLKKREATGNVEEVAAGTNTEVAVEAEGQPVYFPHELPQEELDRIHEDEAREAAQDPPEQENLPAAQGNSLAALVEAANEGGEDWEGQDYIPTIYIDKDEKEGAILDSDGHEVVPVGGSMVVSIIRSHQQCTLYEKTYEEFQEILKSDPEAEKKIMCRSANGLVPDADIKNPFCGEIQSTSPCRKRWDKRKKRFVADCPFMDDGRCVERTCLLVVDYTPQGEDIYNDKELVGHCIDNEDYRRLFPTKELFWMTISGFGWTTYGDFRKDIRMALGRFNKLKMAPRIKTPGVLAFSVSATNENKDSYGNKRWCFDFNDIRNLHTHMGDINIRIAKAVNDYHELSEGDEGFEPGVRAEMQWIEQALQDVAEHVDVLKSGGQPEEG